MFSFIILAGLPPTSVRGGTSLVTVELAAMTAPSPMVTPGMIVHPEHSHTLSPMCTGA